ncbi:MAG: FIST C-terminal domain-containing protein, partial [Candidatus Omnitrophica bacterium]|nr:FIST C-terminal domain-containing protein [Candidatus Omnitrophota bacterium]
REAVKEAKANLGAAEKIDLAMVFSSVDLASAGLLKTIDESLGGIPIIGCSTAAVLSHQGIFRQGLLIALFSLPKEVQFNFACIKDVKTKTALIAGQELGEKLLYRTQNLRRDLSLMFSDGLLDNSQNLILGLQERLGRSFPLVGGSASDNLNFLKTYVFFNDGLFDNAACAILWLGKLTFGFGIRHGWKPLGKPRQVTKSMNNVVYEIDGLAAAKIYEDYLSCSLHTLKKELKRISALYPIGIYLEGETEYLLRNIISITDEGHLICQGDIPQGSHIRLMIGTKESCLAAARQAVGEAKKALFGQKPSVVFIFDSISRYLLLGRTAAKELDIIRAEFGQDTPLIGCYTYGEQAPLSATSYQGQAYFHNQTITVLALGM